MPTAAPLRFQRIAEVTRLTGLSRPSIYRLIRLGLFPRPVKIVPGGRASGWPADAVEQYLRQRIEAAQEAAA